MASKFLRQYLLSVTSAQGEEINITDPISVEFEITRQNLASLNTATFTVYNLAERTRMAIFHDIYDISKYLPVVFYAGYNYGSEETNTFLAQCFKGHIKQAYSVREGSNYKTVIECWDGGTALNSSFTSQTVPSGNPVKSILNNLIGSMANIAGAVIGNQFEDVSQRATTLFGAPVDIANKISGGNFYIDNQTAFAMKRDEVIDGTLNVIDNRVGILESPRRTGTQIEVTTTFEPRYVPSQQVLLNSTVTPIYNGQYKITGISHQGIISDAVGGDLRTNLTLTGFVISDVIKTNVSDYFKQISAAQ